MWLTSERAEPGPVFGNRGLFSAALLTFLALSAVLQTNLLDLESFSTRVVVPIVKSQS